MLHPKVIRARWVSAFCGRIKHAARLQANFVVVGNLSVVYEVCAVSYFSVVDTLSWVS